MYWRKLDIGYWNFDYEYWILDVGGGCTYMQVEEMYRGEFDIGAEKKLSLNIEDTRYY